MTRSNNGAPQRRGTAGIFASNAVGASRFDRIPAPGFVSIASREDQAKATSQSTKMAATFAHTGTPVYVRPPVAVIAARRKKGKAQRRARAAHRRAARS